MPNSSSLPPTDDSTAKLANFFTSLIKKSSNNKQKETIPFRSPSPADYEQERKLAQAENELRQVRRQIRENIHQGKTSNKKLHRWSTELAAEIKKNSSSRPFSLTPPKGKKDRESQFKPPHWTLYRDLPLR